MTKAYHYGADRLWVFNVGDIKPAEMEIEFAMDLAWNVDKWPPAKVGTYIHDWATRTFGAEFADTITRIKEQYYLLAQSGKPEHINSVRYTDAQADARLAQYQDITVKAVELYRQIPARLKDAYYELIFYPVASAYSMNQKILNAQKSLQLAAEGDEDASTYAKRANKAYRTIQLLTDRYNDSIAGGKWLGIMSWHPRDQAVFKMPPVATQQMIDSAKAARNAHPPMSGVGPPTVRVAPVIIPASAATHQKENASFQTIPGLGAGGNGMTVFPFTAAESTTDTAFSAHPWLEYSTSLAPGAHTLLVKCLPTQSISSKGLLRYAVSINNEPPLIVNIHTESESKAWKENVLRGFAQGKSTHTTTAGMATIRIYFLDPGLVINELEID